jgi:hypothetical protein
VNIQCLRHKVDQLAVAISDCEPDILCICEHWLKADELSVISLSKYTFVSSYCRETYKNGGVAIFAHHKAINSIKVFNVCMPEEKTFKSAVCSYNSPMGILILLFMIISLCRSPCGDFHTFLTKLEHLISLVYASNRILVLTGDFNCDLLVDSLHRSELLTLFNSFGLKSLIDNPTRITASSATLLDYVVSNFDQSETFSTVSDPGLSDHSMVTTSFNLNLHMDNTKRKIYYKRSFSDSNIHHFGVMLKGQKWDEVYEASNVDDGFSYFYMIFKYYFDLCFPSRKFK